MAGSGLYTFFNLFGKAAKYGNLIANLRINSLMSHIFYTVKLVNTESIANIFFMLKTFRQHKNWYGLEKNILLKSFLE